MTEALHAFLSPSSAARWSRCTKAPHVEPNYPDRGNAASDLGTKAHEALEVWLQGKDPNTLPFFNKEMSDNLAPVMQYVRNRCNETGMNITGIEKKYDVGMALGFLPGIIWGTADVSMASVFQYEILDLKYGTWPVAPEENEQLILYLCGMMGDALSMLPPEYPVRLTIAQPRATTGDPIKYWDTTVNVIRDHQARLAAAASQCYTAPEFVPGEKQCQWCRARDDCEARRQHIVGMVEEQFLPLGMAMREGKDPTNEYLSNMMRKIPELENALSDIKKEAYRRAAQGDFPGWKLIQGRRQRRWTEEEEALSKIQKWRVDGKALGMDVARPRGAISPAQAEKIPGLSTKQKNLLQSMISISHGKPKLVPEADPHPAVTVDVEQYFNATQEEEE